MTSFKADLHCHTTHSDGTFTPQELLELCMELGIQGLAITDHDTVSAYLEIAPSFAKEKIDLISGVEISTELDGENVHILGYAFDPTNIAIHEFCRLHRLRRDVRNLQILEKLTSKGMLLEPKDILDPKNQTVTYGRPHIAQAMVKKGYVKDVAQAFRKYIGNGKPCYVSGDKWTPQEAIDRIHEAKGKAIIAHPHLIENKNILEKLLAFNFDGIEVYYSRFGDDENKKWLKIAQEKNWLATGGSDFHGAIKPDVKLGCSLTPEKTFKELLSHFNQVVH